MLYKVEKINADIFKIVYSRTIKDIDGEEVVIEDGVYEKRISDVNSEIAYHEAQRLNYEGHIARLQKELEEIDKLK